jgi:hypothetical protein
MPTPTLHFAAAARVLGDVARGEGWVVPGFRSPPRRVGSDRTLRRAGDQVAVVAVRLRGRPWLAVLGDMVEGVVVANRLSGSDADRCRTALWSALESRTVVGVAPVAGVPAPPDRPRSPAPRVSDATVTPSPGWRNRQTQAA